MGVNYSYLFTCRVLGGTSEQNKFRMVPPFYSILSKREYQTTYM